MKNKIVFIALLSALCLLLTSCGKLPPLNRQGDTYRDIHIQKLAFQLNDSLRRPALKNKEIGIMTFVNLNDLNEAEPLGRHLQEKLSHELFDLGFRIIEIRLGKAIRYYPKKGELNLSRLKEELKRTEFSEIQSFIVGTYIDAGDYVHVNSKLIELENATVRASGEIKIRKGPYLKKLLKIDDDELRLGKKDVYERFPTKK